MPCHVNRHMVVLILHGWIIPFPRWFPRSFSIPPPLFASSFTLFFPFSRILVFCFLQGGSSGGIVLIQYRQQ
ncbi:hypothetical protein B9Z19DRAFT_1087652 [Tuber borchii]|uniref:Uncharacterized protein n=1 Tax=Tuber borchii TaxID=42251 RepID=A0A2T6ZMR2_TUBBO|nr:hypothetical protein B9Z19DRAFT_1087652 [Tuber borchii]